MSHDERLPECKDTHCRIENKVDKHIDESMGVRDRLKTLEMQYQNIKDKVDSFPKEVMRNAIIGGIIGALIGSGAAPAITTIASIFIK